jgi:hypothetical protein
VTIGSFARHVPFAVSALLQIVVMILGVCHAHSHTQHASHRCNNGVHGRRARRRLTIDTR